MTAEKKVTDLAMEIKIKERLGELFDGASSTRELTVEDLLVRLVWLTAALEERKKLYTEYDQLIMTLVENGFERAEFADSVFELCDNFAKGKNTAWTSAAVKRYEIEIITKELAAKRIAKREKVK